MLKLLHGYEFWKLEKVYIFQTIEQIGLSLTTEFLIPGLLLMTEFISKKTSSYQH